MRDSEVYMNNDVCARERPQPPTTTIKDKVDDPNMTLADCLGIVNQFCRSVWGEDMVVPEAMEVKSSDDEAALIRAWMEWYKAALEEIQKSAEAPRGTGENNES